MSVAGEHGVNFAEVDLQSTLTGMDHCFIFVHVHTPHGCVWNLHNIKYAVYNLMLGGHNLR